MQVKTKNDKAICFRLSNKLNADLINVAKIHNATTSEVIRHALKTIIEDEI
jgi:predicted DNA-binding protein|tara:strand:- start:182 stop:334 length:153 start_codon:yes stop_codon:yes gene_type:complete